jgi:hypothetical protein
MKLKQLMRVCAAAGAALAITTAIPLSPAAAQTNTCKVSGPAEQYNLTLDDFGRGGEPYTREERGDYWGGNGHMIAYSRGDYDSWLSSPWGGTVTSGVVIQSDASQATADMKSAVSGWTDQWKEINEIHPSQQVGEEMMIVSRLTPWEIAAEQPMTQVFLSFRRCNASVQIDLYGMPKLDPIGSAIRYAQIIDQRLPH